MESVLLVHLGLKYYIKEAGSLKANVTLNLSKPIVTGKVVDDEIEEDFVKDAIKGFSSFGGELSFGVEYFFDEHFSVGGDFGLRYLHVGTETSEETTVFNGLTGLEEASTNTYRSKINATPTFSRIGLNFYF